MIFEIISGGEKTDWVGKELAGLFFPRGKNGPAHSFPGEKTDWGEIPACYTASIFVGELLQRQRHFWAWPLYILFQCDVRHRLHCLVLTGTFLYIF